MRSGSERVLTYNRAVLDLAVGAQQHETRRVRARAEHERFLAAQTEVEPQQVGRRPRAGVLLDGDDAADEQLRQLGLFAHAAGMPTESRGSTCLQRSSKPCGMPKSTRRAPAASTASAWRATSSGVPANANRSRRSSGIRAPAASWPRARPSRQTRATCSGSSVT